MSTRNELSPNAHLLTVANPSTQVEVLDLIHLSDRTAVRATCRVRIGAVVISEVKVIYRVLASRIFVGWPSRKHDDGWRPLVQILSPSLEDAVHRAVISAWKNGTGV